MREVVDVPLLFWIANRSRAKLPLPRWVFPVVVVGVLVTIGVKVTYDRQIKLFWDEIRDKWFAHERKLAEDPRNQW
jgi:hypothetical protein